MTSPRAPRAAAALLALLTAAGAVAVASPGSASAVVGLPATVVPAGLASAPTTYPTTLADGTQTSTRWQVTKGSGNCCENHLAVTPGGRLLDFGGTYPHFSDDGGVTWSRVEPTTPLVNGEGTLAVAPNGDVIGIGWDPYTGDHLQAFKFEAASGRWLWAEQPLHTPFYDRQWVAVVPGPIVVDGQERPYAVVLRGGYPSKDVYQLSGDGLTYLTLSSKQLDAALGTAATGALAPQVSAHTDYGQTPLASNLTPLGARAILTGRDLLSPLPPVTTCPSSTFLAGASLTWSCYRPAEGPSVLWQAVDSTGRLHATRWSMDGTVEYVTSTDGGRTVQTSRVPLPEGFGAPRRDAVDIKANAAAGVVAIGVHASNATTGQSQDMVAEYRYVDGVPQFAALHRVGKGDLVSGSGVSSTAPRFDFATVAVLPDGRIATSFNDSANRSPSVAVLSAPPVPRRGSAPTPLPGPVPVPNAPDEPTAPRRWS